MKKLLVIISFSGVVIGCGQNKDAKQSTTEEKGTATASTENPDYAKGLELVGKSDCLTCHKINEKSIGPAYQEVANRYTATADVLDTLSQKIITGGSGRWGSIPMTAHPQITKEDAITMVKYIMTLKK